MSPPPTFLRHEGPRHRDASTPLFLKITPPLDPCSFFRGSPVSFCGSFAANNRSIRWSSFSSASKSLRLLPSMTLIAVDSFSRRWPIYPLWQIRPAPVFILPKRPERVLSSTASILLFFPLERQPSRMILIHQDSRSRPMDSKSLELLRSKPFSRIGVLPPPPSSICLLPTLSHPFLTVFVRTRSSLYFFLSIRFF